MSMKAAASNGVESASLVEIQADATALSSSIPPVVKNRPPKKRKFESQEENQFTSDKKSYAEKRYGMDDIQMDKPDEKSAVESMMELAKNPL